VQLGFPQFNPQLLSAQPQSTSAASSGPAMQIQTAQEGNFKIGSITSHDEDNNPQQTLFIFKRQRPLLNNYNVIPDEKRFRLIEMVIHRHMKVKEASQILNINY
jgi:hypothetical protein